jgi:hypothetical protein
MPFRIFIYHPTHPCRHPTLRARVCACCAADFSSRGLQSSSDRFPWMPPSMRAAVDMTDEEYLAAFTSWISVAPDM